MDGSALPVIPRLRAPVKAKNMKLRQLLALCLPLAGCQGTTFSNHTALSDAQAFRGEWQTQHLTDFVHRDGEDILISGIVIGGLGTGDNFANRGDVIVTYDLPGSIEIRTRAFASALTEDGAQEQFDKLHLWLYDERIGSPQLPAFMPPDASCDTGAWREGCGIRVYYEDSYQPIRTGVDLHVRLPPDFTGRIEIETEDLLSDDYDNRGDVCIADLPGSATVDLERGIVEVTTSDALQIAPSCPDADVAACESWSTPWASDCPCFAKGYTLGQLQIDGSATDITVDTPSDVWTVVTAVNLGAKPNDCLVDVAVPGAQPIDPARGIFEIARPAGASQFGYGISAFSDECQPVVYTDHPDGSPLEERRGDITICTGCIQSDACDDFLRGSIAPRWR